MGNGRDLEIAKLEETIERLKDQNARILEINQGLCIENTHLKVKVITEKEYNQMLSELAAHERNNNLPPKEKKYRVKVINSIGVVGVFINKTRKQLVSAMDFYKDEDIQLSISCMDTGTPVALRSIITPPYIEDYGGARYDMRFWQCDCKDNFIHPKSMDECNLCGGNSNDCSDAREVDVQYYIGDEGGA